MAPDLTQGHPTSLTGDLTLLSIGERGTAVPMEKGLNLQEGPLLLFPLTPLPGPVVPVTLNVHLDLKLGNRNPCILLTMIPRSRLKPSAENLDSEQ